MAIRNTAGLDALRALSEGGSAGLGAYKAAQGKETASRTSALQGALGGNDVAAAAAKAQGEYSPTVDTSGISVGNLGAAASNYLSRAANKLSAQKYEDQQNLTLQGEALKRQQVSEKDKALMLQASADAMGEAQLGDVEANAALAPQLGNLAQRKANLREDLTAFDQANQANGGTAALAAGAAAGNPELLAQMQAAKAQQEQQRGDILRAMAGVDEQYNAAAGQYATHLGTDAGGLLERYKAADQGPAGNTEAVRSFLGEEGMKGMATDALGQRQREVAAGGQTRLRSLATDFGIDPLVAAGMFREGASDDKDLAETSRLADEESFIAGETSPKEDDEAAATALGFPSVTDYKQVRGRTNMTAEDIDATMKDPAWGGITAAYEENVVNGGDFDDLKTGLKDYVNGLTKPEGMTDEQWRKKKTQIIELGTSYYKDAAKTTEE